MDTVGGTFGARRGEFDLTLEILRLVSRGEGRTRIMYGANISHVMLKRYLDGLVEKGFVAPTGDAYVLTPSGHELRRDMERVLAHFSRDDTRDLAAERIRRFGTSA
jgi:predicted transcriptional regulator